MLKRLRLPLLVLTALGLIISVGFALEGSVEKGKEYFTNPSFAGGKKACNNISCHPEGRGLETAGEKKSFVIFGQKVMGIEGAVNICIEGANKGKAIPEGSQEMKDIVAYIKSLGKKAAPGYDAPSYGTPGYGK